METKKNGLALKDELSQQVMKRRDITATAKFILIAILSRVDWTTWKSSTSYKIVSQRDLADLAGTNYKTVSKCMEQLEKLKLIERDVFQSTKTTAAPIKVNIKLIQAYEPKKIKRYKRSETKKSLPTFKPEEVQRLSAGDNQRLSAGDNQKVSLSIDNNNRSIYSQYINPSLTLGQECIKDSAYNGSKNHWGVPDDELWGNHLHNDLLNVIPQNIDIKDKD